MKRLFLLFFAFGFVVSNVIGAAVSPKKPITVPLPEIVNPTGVFCDANQLYITEEAVVHIYSLKDYKLIKKFGRKGEGPAEFKVRHDQPLALCLRPNDLVVASIARLSYFTKTGDFKKEIKSNHTYAMTAQAYGNGFIGVGVVNEGKGFLGLNIYDHKLKKLKEVHRIEEELQREGKKGKFLFLQFPIANNTSFASYKNKIFSTWGSDNALKVFDPTGKLTGKIVPKNHKIKLTAEYKKRVILHYKNDKAIPPPIYQIFYKNIRFPEYFPAIRDLRIADDKIHIITYKKKSTKTAPQTECQIFTPNGKKESVVYLPLIERDAISHHPFTIGNGTLYQLSENSDEQFQLHATKID